MLCSTCQAAREDIKTLMSTQWECLISHYEFMIVLASFRRNIIFYANIEYGQLRKLYSQLVSFSAAKILVIDSIISKYRKEIATLTGVQNPPYLSNDLIELLVLSIGNHVPEYYIRDCISSCDWKGYANVILALFASAEMIRSGPLKFITIIKEIKRDRSFHRSIISLAVTAWIIELSGSKCVCGTWTQATDLLSCFVPDTETTLAIQAVARISSYICTLLDLPHELVNGSDEVDTDNQRLNYGYTFNDLLVPGLDTTK